MSSPGWTIFCHNGHIAQTTPPSIIQEGITACSICGSTQLKQITEWPDSSGRPHLVPEKPLAYETYQPPQQVPIYDVSQLFTPCVPDQINRVNRLKALNARFSNLIHELIVEHQSNKNVEYAIREMDYRISQWENNPLT